MHILDDQNEPVATSKPTSITFGHIELTRVNGGWIVETSAPVDIAQLDAAVQWAKAAPLEPAVAEPAVSVIGDEVGSGDTVGEASSMLTDQGSFGAKHDDSPSAEFGVGPADYSDPVYSIHVLSLAKLKELVQSDVLKVPIKMLEIGGECVPDKTFAGTTVTTEAHVEWYRHIWPVWKLHEDGFVELSVDGKTARITRRGQRCLQQIADGSDSVYGRFGDVLQPPQPSDSQVGLVDDGWGGTIPSTWVEASRNVRQMIVENVDPKVVADGLWAVVQGLKLSVEDTEDFVYWACDRAPYRESLRHYDHADDVAEDIKQRLKALPAAI